MCSMPDKEDVIRLKHMLDAARDVISFTQNKTRSSLDTDKMLGFSLVRCIEIIGEAASKITKQSYDEFPQIPWKKIINMRNRIIHAYYDINLDVVWSTITEDLPPLIVELEKIISTEEGSKR